MAFPYATEHQLDMLADKLTASIPDTTEFVVTVPLVFATDGEGIQHLAFETGENATYEEVAELIKDKTKIVYVEKDEALRCYFSTTDGSSINFTNTYVTGTDIYFDCASIKTGNVVTWTETKLN